MENLIGLVNCCQTNPAKSCEYVQNFRRVPPGPAWSRRPLTGHQRVHRSLNAPPCVLTVFHRPHEIYRTVAHSRLSRRHVTATLDPARPGESFGHTLSFSPGGYKRWHTVRTRHEHGKRTGGRNEVVMDPFVGRCSYFTVW